MSLNPSRAGGGAGGIAVGRADCVRAEYAVGGFSVFVFAVFFAAVDFFAGNRGQVFQTAFDKIAEQGDVVFGSDAPADFAFRAGEAGGGLVVAADEEVAAAVQVFVVDVVGEAVVVYADFVVQAAAVVGEADFKVVGTLFFQLFVAVLEGLDGKVFAVVIQLHRGGQAFVVRGGEGEAVGGGEIPQECAGIGKRAFAAVGQIGLRAAAEGGGVAADKFVERGTVVMHGYALPLPACAGFEGEAAEFELFEGKD